MEMKKIQKKIAIVTGASAGLGTEFARYLEKNFLLDEIWLIARRIGPMRELADTMQKAKGVPLSYDLTNVGDLVEFDKLLKKENPNVLYLVNNAGYGKIGAFEQLGLEEQIKMIDLNVRALTYLSKIVLPFMKSGSAVIQVASSIAFCPSPFFAVYAASKSFVLSLSEALNFELKDRGIQVLAVCPGPVETEFFSIAKKSETAGITAPEKAPFNASLMAEAHAVVAKAFSDLGRRRRRSIYGMPIKLFAFFIPFVPMSLAFKMLGKRTLAKNNLNT